MVSVLGSLAFLKDQTLQLFCWKWLLGWGGRCRAPLQPWCVCGGAGNAGLLRALPQPWRGWWGSEQLPLRGAWLLRMEAEGGGGWGLGTSATPLLSGEEGREEEQLLTCLSAQLFVSRSPRGAEAAGVEKAAGQGRPAFYLGHTS